ncbi:hypothetical protein F4804DRAFT_23024 [Jackrogersella minutella]|nr:hypothetical protein F4804DRAFT_23024 [Jackrogersella minutella]
MVTSIDLIQSFLSYVFVGFASWPPTIAHNHPWLVHRCVGVPSKAPGHSLLCLCMQRAAGRWETTLPKGCSIMSDNSCMSEQHYPSPYATPVSSPTFLLLVLRQIIRTKYKARLDGSVSSDPVTVPPGRFV